MMLAIAIKPKGEGEDQGGQEERKKIRRKENKRGTKNRDIRELQEHINLLSLYRALKSSMVQMKKPFK
jgi:hypothetical protein